MAFDQAAQGLAAKALKRTRPQLLGRQLRVIPFGDSNTAGSSAFANGLWQFGPGYAETAIYRAGRRFTVVRNAGVSGNTTAQMHARLQTDVLDYSPDVVPILGGTNDLTSGMTDAALTTMFQNLEDIVARCLNAGVLPVIVTCPPKNGAALESRKAQVLYYLLAQSYGIPLLDSYRLLVGAATGSFNASYSGDGTHWNTAGIAVLADAFASLLADLDAAHPGPYLAAYSETSTGNFANLLRNGNFARSVSPPTPDSWAVNSTGATPTLETPVTPYNGNTFKYVKASGGAVYGLSGSSLSVGSGLAVGDELVFSGRIKSSGRSSPVGFHVALERGGGVNFRPMASWLQDGDFVFSAEMTVPSGTSTLTPTLYIQDVGTYEVNNLTVWNKTAARAIWSPRYL